MKQACLLLLLTMHMGCTTLFCPRDVKDSACTSTMTGTELPETTRKTIRFNCDLGENIEVNQTPLEQKPYKTLTVEQCRDIAAENSVFAQIITRELTSRLSQPQPVFEGSTDRYNLIIRILRDSVRESKNRSSAAALELYFRILEAEAQADLVAQIVQLIQQNDDALKQLIKKELINGDQQVKSEIALGEALAEQRKLQLTIDQLNEKLQGILGIQTPGVTYRIWPDASPAIAQEQIDVPGLVQLAYTQRADIDLLRGLVEATNSQTFEIVQKVLTKSIPVLELPSHLGPVREFLIHVLSACYRQEQVARNRDQARRLLLEREDLTRREIERISFSIQDRLQLISLTAKKRKQHLLRVQQLEPLGADSLNKRPDLLQAKIDQLKSCGDIIHEMVEHQIAVVKLKEAIGEYSGRD